MVCGVVFCWEFHYFPFSYCQFLVWVRHSLLRHACTFFGSSCCLLVMSERMYTLLCTSCVLSLSSLALTRICFFSAIVGSCTLRSLILLADGLPSLVTETILVRMWNSAPRRLCTPCISSCSVYIFCTPYLFRLLSLAFCIHHSALLYQGL